MKRWKLSVCLLAILLSGIAVGFGLGAGYTKNKVEHMLTGDHPRPHDLLVRRLTRELKLNDTQRAHLEKVVCRAHLELFNIRRMHQPEFDRIMTESVVEAKQVLDPEQSRKLDELYLKAKNRWGRWKGPTGKDGQPECK